MSQAPEQGNGWEVIRGFVPPETVELLGQQALALIAEPHPDVKVIHQHRLSRDVSIYEMEDWDIEALPDTDLYQWMEATIPDVVAVARQTMAQREVDDGKLVVNLYHGDGRILAHRDSDDDELGPIDRRAIKVTGGDDEFWIRDPLTEVWHCVSLSCGDAVDIHNTDFPKSPIVHMILNRSSQPRVAIVK